MESGWERWSGGGQLSSGDMEQWLGMHTFAAKSSLRWRGGTQSVTMSSGSILFWQILPLGGWSQKVTQSIAFWWEDYIWHKKNHSGKRGGHNASASSRSTRSSIINSTSKKQKTGSLKLKAEYTLAGKFHDKKSEFNSKKLDLRFCHLPRPRMRERTGG